MEATINYIMQSGLCLLVLYLFYITVLCSSTRLTYNRLYLLLAPLVALVIPVLNLPLPDAAELSITPALAVVQLPEITVTNYKIAPETSGLKFNLATLLVLFYCLTVVALLCRVGMQLYRLRKLYTSSTPLPSYTSGTKVLQTTSGYPTFAFLNYVFVNPQQNLSPQEEQQILAHEMAHVRLRHTYDVLYFEIVTAILWFNPVAWLLKNELRDVHEFQADAEVVSVYQPQVYTSLLAKEALYNSGIPVGSYFYKPQVFKRLQMLQKHGQKPGWLRTFLVLPLLLLMFFFFSAKEVTADIATTLSEPITQIPATEKAQPAPTESINPEESSPAIVVTAKAPEQKPPTIQPVKKVQKEAALEEENKPAPEPATEQPLMYVEQMPQFKGGEEEFKKFLAKTIRYPKTTKEAGISGLVVASFVVETDGSLTEASILRGIDEAADKETLRIIGNMQGMWEPGMQNGKAVRVRYTIPVRFTLQE